ncbi:hypothetical protein [Burkholderia stabilis]|uniref:Uncharacterized protein n=1 Tax=Burkholderia stabilis TaxID=95485 RepID=A0AAJ5T8T1_9BURK|nr:hypothetical protein [Burkholderia stabilis]VBB16728.1 hypothetical protein BSTAB16_6935 [Burkholderia stabilis]
MKRSDANHRANQGNPNNQHHQQTKDNRSNQLNPKHPAYQQGRTDQKSGKNQ